MVFSHSFSFASSIAMNGQQDGSTLPPHLLSDPRNWEMESGVSSSHTHAISETHISVLRGTAVTRNFHEISYLGVYIFNCLSYCLFVCPSVCLSNCLPVCIASFALRNLNVLQTHQHQHQIQDSASVACPWHHTLYECPENGTLDCQLLSLSHLLSLAIWSQQL